MSVLLPFGSTKKKDPMRQSTAMTTVILLQQNQKFERFMRQKIEELETRVSAQQARISSREKREEQEIWADMEDLEGMLDEVAGSDEVSVSDEVSGSDEAGHPAAGADFAVEEPAEGDIEGEEPAPATGEEVMPPDYVSLMMGAEAGEHPPGPDEFSADLSAPPGGGDAASDDLGENEFEVLSVDRFAAVGSAGLAAEGDEEEAAPATEEDMTPPDYVSLTMGTDAGEQRAETDEVSVDLSAPGENEFEVLSVDRFSTQPAGEAPAVDESGEETAQSDVQQELLSQWDIALAEEEDDGYGDELN